MRTELVENKPQVYSQLWKDIDNFISQMAELRQGVVKIVLKFVGLMLHYGMRIISMCMSTIVLYILFANIGLSQIFKMNLPILGIEVFTIPTTLAIFVSVLFEYFRYGAEVAYLENTKNARHFFTFIGLTFILIVFVASSSVKYKNDKLEVELNSQISKYKESPKAILLQKEIKELVGGLRIKERQQRTLISKNVGNSKSIKSTSKYLVKTLYTKQMGWKKWRELEVIRKEKLKSIRDNNQIIRENNKAKNLSVENKLIFVKDLKSDINSTRVKLESKREKYSNDLDVIKNDTDSTTATYTVLFIFLNAIIEIFIFAIFWGAIKRKEEKDELHPTAPHTAPHCTLTAPHSTTQDKGEFNPIYDEDRVFFDNFENVIFYVKDEKKYSIDVEVFRKIVGVAMSDKNGNPLAVKGIVRSYRNIKDILDINNKFISITMAILQELSIIKKIKQTNILVVEPIIAKRFLFKLMDINL